MRGSLLVTCSWEKSKWELHFYVSRWKNGVCLTKKNLRKVEGRRASCSYLCVQFLRIECANHYLQPLPVFTAPLLGGRDFTQFLAVHFDNYHSSFRIVEKSRFVIDFFLFLLWLQSLLFI